jgi:hypothetical protein
MPETIPPEIIAHQNRISPELREFLIQTLEGRFTSEASKQIGRILWNLVEDPVYETDEELKYLASKIGVMVGQYDLAIKCISEDIPGTRVWGSIALFEIGEVDQAFSHLDHIIETESSDLIPLVEALFWIIYLKLLIGNTENIDNYKGMLLAIFDERHSRLIPGQLQEIKDFAEGLVEQQSANNIEGLKKIEEFIEKRKEANDQFWQLIALLTIGEQKVDSSDFISSEQIYTQTKELAENLSNIPLTGASDIGLANAYYLKGELKKGNILSAQTIDKLQGISQYYLAKANFIRGQILKKLGHHKLARDSLNTSYAFANQYHDYNRSFLALLALADSYIITNEKEEAQEIYDKAYNHVVNIANKRQFTRALVQIAIGDYRQGNIENAMKRVDQIETLSEEIQYQRGKTDALRVRAQIAISRNDDIKRQILILKACQILYFEVGDAESQANCDILIAEAYTRLGDISKAGKHLDEAKEFYLKISDSMKIAEIKELQASFDIQEGRYDEALVKLRSSYSHYSDVFDRNKRVRCLRKIADILALKGDFQESIIRYKKVQEITIESNNIVENVIINLNRARINLYLENYDKIIDDYKYAERFLFENGLDEILVDILAEKGLLYIFSEKEELYNEVVDKLGEREKEGIRTAKIWINFLKGIKQIQAGEYNDAYGSLISTLQEALEVDKLISAGVLFNLIRIIAEIYKENLEQSFVTEEVNNYLGLINGIVNESKFYYLKGLSFLVNLLWQIITDKEKDHNEIVVQASEYFASTGIEEFGNFLLILQFNMAEWFGMEGVKIQSVFATPKKFETPQSALMELLEKAGKAIILENLLSTEREILENL